MLEATTEVSADTETNLDLASPGKTSQVFVNDYVQLQRRIYLATLVVSAIAVLTAAIFLDFRSSISLLIGALSGILYLRLLARSIGKLGKSTKSVSKIQLVVPVLLVLAVSRLPQLELLPALLGFLLYKPSLLIQGLLEFSQEQV